MSIVAITTRIQKDDEKTFNQVNGVRDCLSLQDKEGSIRRARSTKAKVLRMSKVQADTYGEDEIARRLR